MEPPFFLQLLKALFLAKQCSYVIFENVWAPLGGPKMPVKLDLEYVR